MTWKTQTEWFDEYAKYHQNKLNQKIHFLCVPAIYFSIIGLISAIPHTFIQETLSFTHPVFDNYATFILSVLMLFYLSLSIRIFILMAIFSILSLYLIYYISIVVPIVLVMVIIFILAWLGQLYGHKIEGKPPALTKDFQFLLIGPAWVFYKITN